MTTAIVIPCSRSLSKEFLRPLPKDTPIYVVNDSSEDVLIENDSGKNIIRLRESDQDALFKNEYHRSSFFTRRSSGCRNVGILKAYNDGADIIINLDDDVIVPETFVQDHENALINGFYKKVSSNKKWFNTIGTDRYYARGIPYEDRVGYQWNFLDGQFSLDEVLVHMGMWNNVLDYNGVDKIAAQFTEDMQTWTPFELGHYGASEKYIPLCAMNCSAKRESAMALLQIPMGQQFTHQYKMYRIEDIWGGYIWQSLYPGTTTFGAPTGRHLKVGNLNWEIWGENYANVLAKDFENAIDACMVGIEPRDNQAWRYHDLAYHLDRYFNGTLQFESTKPCPDYMREFIFKLSRTLETWSHAFGFETPK